MANISVSLTRSHCLFNFLFLILTPILPLVFFPANLSPYGCKHSKNSYVHINTKPIWTIWPLFGMPCQLHACTVHIQSQLVYRNNSRVQKATLSLPANMAIKTHLRLHVLFSWYPAIQTKKSINLTRSYTSETEPSAWCFLREIKHCVKLFKLWSCISQEWKQV